MTKITHIPLAPPLDAEKAADKPRSGVDKSGRPWALVTLDNPVERGGEKIVDVLGRHVAGRIVFGGPLAEGCDGLLRQGLDLVATQRNFWIDEHVIPSSLLIFVKPSLPLAWAPIAKASASPAL